MPEHSDTLLWVAGVKPALEEMDRAFSQYENAKYALEVVYGTYRYRENTSYHAQAVKHLK